MGETGNLLMNNIPIEEESWYAIMTKYQKEKHIADYLEKKGFQCFIPMQYKEIITRDGKKDRQLKPAVHNLLFIESNESEDILKEYFSQCPYPIIVVKDGRSKKWYKIPNSQMIEIRAICDPNYTGTLYVDPATAEAKPGEEVLVIRGSFKGLKGKLVRYKKRYYVVIIVATLGVMIHIPKWYCEKIVS